MIIKLTKSELKTLECLENGVTPKSPQTNNAKESESKTWVNARQTAALLFGKNLEQVSQPEIRVARNAFRRLVREFLIATSDAVGYYQITEKGQNVLKSGTSELASLFSRGEVSVAFDEQKKVRAARPGSLPLPTKKPPRVEDGFSKTDLKVLKKVKKQRKTAAPSAKEAEIIKVTTSAAPDVATNSPPVPKTPVRKTTAPKPVIAVKVTAEIPPPQHLAIRESAPLPVTDIGSNGKSKTVRRFKRRVVDAAAGGTSGV